MNVANETVAMTGRLRDTSKYFHSVVLVLAADTVCVLFTVDGAQEVQEGGGIDYFIQPWIGSLCIHTPYVSCQRHFSSPSVAH